MLKDILNKRNISVYKLSKDAGIPYTTVNELVLGKKKIKDCSYKTLKSIADYLNLPIESLFNDKKTIVSHNYLDSKKKKYIFNKVIETDLFDISRIHPLKQRLSLDLVNILRNDERIKSVIVFGSSTNITCTISSDIDIAILLKKEYINKDNKDEISELIQKITNYNADIIWLDHIKEDSYLYENIMKGVVIYEQVTSKSES